MNVKMDSDVCVAADTVNGLNMENVCITETPRSLPMPMTQSYICLQASLYKPSVIRIRIELVRKNISVE